MVVVHPLGCGFSSIGSTCDMNTQALQPLLIQCLLSLKPTCEASNQRSQQRDRSRNEIRRREYLAYRQDAIYWLHWSLSSRDGECTRRVPWR